MEDKIEKTESKVFKTEDKGQKTADGFDNFVSRLGLNNNNTLSAGIYTFNLMTRNRVELEAAYRGSWIVGRVIDCFAEDMTRAGIEITSNEAEEEIKDLQAKISRLQIWNSLRNLIRWGRLYGGSIAVMQIEGQDLETPLDISTVGENQFLGLSVFDRWQLNPNLFELIPNGPNMGLPMYYDITTYAAGQNALSQSSLEMPTPAPIATTGMMRVHYSRVIRMTGIELPFFQAITEMLWGESILERLWDRLISFDTATMSCANLIERANNRTVSIDNLREIVAAGGAALKGLEAQFAMMREFQTNEGMTLLDKNDTFQTSNYTFTGLSDLMLQFGQQLAGASDTPMVRLFGQSPAGLNSTGESDIRMYYDNVFSQQEAKLRQGLDTLIKVIWRSTFGDDAPKDLEFTFVPLWQMSALDQANIAKTNTETIIGAEENGLLSKSAAMKELRQMSKETGIFTNITDEEIEEAEEEPPPIPEISESGKVEPITLNAKAENKDTKWEGIKK